MGKILVLIEVVSLVLITALIDEALMRVALSVAPGLLLAQRALEAPDASEGNTRSGFEDRRHDPVIRNYVDELLNLVRQFHTACHLLRSGQITYERATERTGEIEGGLNRMLADIMKAAKQEATSEIT